MSKLLEQNFSKLSHFSLVVALLPWVAMAHCLTFTLDEPETVLSVVSEKFLSVALDCSSIESRYASFNLR